MANIIWTPHSGWVEETGAHVSFKAPCDCAVAGSLVIGSNSYSIVDALGKVITGTGGAFASGAVLDFILDCENSKAYLQNAATALKLLWSNASPGSSFASQSISLDLSLYTAVVVVCTYATGTQRDVSTLCQVGRNGFCTLIWGDDNVCASRAFYTSTSGVEFASGYSRGSTSYNSAMVPICIYGVK